MKRYPRHALAAAATLGLVLATTLAAGCQSYVFEPVVPALISVNNTTYQLTDVSSADILFVVDDSGSMAGEQANLAANFDVFINALEAENQTRRDNGDPELDYRLAVASTSVSLKYELADGTVVEQSNYGAALSSAECQSNYTDAAGDPFPEGRLLAAPGNQAILDSTTLDGATIISQFRQNVRLGVCGSGQEQGLWAARRVLEANPTFLREKSRLVVIFLSDEEDCSDPDGDLILSLATDRCIEQADQPSGGLLGPVSAYADFFQGLAEAAGSDVLIGSIVSATGTRPNVSPGLCSDSGCEAACAISDPTTDPRNTPCWCGGLSAGGRYLQLADLVGNGSLKDSICQQSFSDTLRDLAEVIVKVEVIWLNARPFEDDPKLMLLKIIRGDDEILCESPTDSIQVDPRQTCANAITDPTVDIDWEYDATELSIRLCDNSSCKIQPGDSYKVSFVERACSAETPCQ